MNRIVSDLLLIISAYFILLNIFTSNFAENYQQKQAAPNDHPEASGAAYSVA
ncbi:hypothetical protein [Tropheryma whipplei]|nr:hypothetical protein [Tropheryma whipplei]MCO8190703.1 hypothetical protein [Tropheryma whipplei]